MTIQKNKTFILELPEISKCHAIYLTKDEKDYILVKKEDLRIFKVCLNENHESEDYESIIGLTRNRKKAILDILHQSYIDYIDINFNWEEFFVDIQPLQIPRSKMRYSLYLEEREDYLKNNEWIGKTIQITSKFFKDEVIVFIYREKNILVYGIMADLKKTVKYIFKLENDMLNLIKEERYNGYKELDFLKFKEDFKNLTTTCHEMQRDIASKDEREVFVLKKFKQIFNI